MASRAVEQPMFGRAPRPGGAGLRRLAPYVRILALPGRDGWMVWLLAGGNLVAACVQFVEPMLFGRVIGLLTRSASLAPEALWQQAAWLLGAWTTIGIAGIGATVGVALGADRLAHRNRLAAMARFFGHVMTLPPSFHATAQSGLLMKLMLAGADAMFWFWLSLFREHLCTLLAALLLLPLSLLINWRLGLVLVALVLVFCSFALVVARRTTGGQSAAAAHHLALATVTQDAVGNVVMMQSFGQVPHERRRFAAIAADVLTHQYPVLAWWALASASARAASTVAVIAIVVVGTRLHLAGQASVGEIVSFMGFATLLIGRLDGGMHFVARLFQELPHLVGYFGVLGTASSVPDRAAAIDLPGTQRGRGGAVQFENVSFAFPGGPPALSSVSFAVAPGRVVALVGHTGAGKSTAMALLQRQWDPLSGRVLIDGHDLRDLRLDSLRRAIGVVFQDSMLLNRSIRDNLLVGKPEATPADLAAACRLAEAEAFVARQPHGLDTLVGERGANLSGGQRQRLAIARAALKDPPILVLDEATSALDAATEARVGVALKALMAGRTTFIIAHRLSTVRDADEILVFEAGRIVERGGFADLLAAGGRFAGLVATQLAWAPDGGEAAATAG